MSLYETSSPFRKPVIKVEEWETIKGQAEAAKELLQEPRFAFLRDYLKSTQDSVICFDSDGIGESP